MIQAYPTKKGTGITILGDYGDLSSLYSTVNKIAFRLYENEGDRKYKGQAQLISNFGYELRHAFQKSRLTEKIDYDNDYVTYYFGFQYLWTDMFFTISALRYNAGFVPLDELDHANLYLLEYWTKKALFAFDPIGAETLKDYIGQWIHTTNELVFLISGAIDLEYLSEKPTIKRFRNIPQLISSYSFNTEKYNKFKLDLERSAKEFNCDILDIEYKDFPEAVW